MAVNMAVRFPDGTWHFDMGQNSTPVRIWDGTKWRVFAGGTGAPLKARDASGNWIIVAREGWTYGRARGEVRSTDGTLLPNRAIYFIYQDSDDVAHAITTVTDANGKYDYPYLPFDVPLTVQIFVRPNSGNSQYSVIAGIITLTQANQTLTNNYTVTVF